MRRVVVFDIETYVDYFVVMFRDVDTKVTRSYELYDGIEFDKAAVLGILRRCQIVGFNSRNYDLPMLMLALRGKSNRDLKAASDAIIQNNMRVWDFEREYGVTTSAEYIDHIDLIEVAPGQASLKLYGGRLHTRKLQDLPYDPSDRIMPDKRDALVEYCGNDLDLTIELYRTLKAQIDLRASMSEQYGVDLRSKSDAQIAEAVIKKEVEKLKGSRVERHEVEPGKTFRYKIPEFIEFNSDTMWNVFGVVKDSRFVVSQKGSVELPRALADEPITIGRTTYRMGIGGLHSCESCVAHFADEDHVLIDRDVASYYPAIILGSNLAPKNMGDDFLKVYRQIVASRLEAKRSGDKLVADTLKIVVNGSFGKLGSKWSILYAPQLLIQVTLTGQLALLMLIDKLEENGISVVSANTDGIVIKAHRSDVAMTSDIFEWWENKTGFQTEETKYRALYSRDVNSYLAIKERGGVKAKGAYAETGLAKNPANRICVEAVIAYLTDAVPLEATICSCVDIRKFVSVKRVSGGAEKAGEYLGKVVRWYYAQGEAGYINYRTNGNKVGKSDGAKPLMELPDRFPLDIDYGRYVTEAQGILKEIGADA